MHARLGCLLLLFAPLLAANCGDSSPSDPPSITGAGQDVRSMPVPGALVPIQNAAITFAAPPTDSGATLDVVYTQNSPSNIATLYYGGVTCEH